MRLHDLLDATEVLEIVHDPSGDATADVSDVTHDTRTTHPGALFCCIPGLRADGHDFASVAVDRGAVALMVERVLAPAVPQARVPSVRRAIGPVAARFHGEPSRAMPVLGVTGTNGKTTTTFFLEAILAASGRRPGVIGTLGVRFEGDVTPMPFTTPEATELQRALADLRGRGADAVAMEVSSHALAEHRVDGTVFAVTCFTNLSRDHLDLHGSVDAYFAAKARLFTAGFTGRAAIDVDDPYGAELAGRARDEGIAVRTFAMDAAGRRAPRRASRGRARHHRPPDPGRRRRRPGGPRPGPVQRGERAGRRRHRVAPRHRRGDDRTRRRRRRADSRAGSSASRARRR